MYFNVDERALQRYQESRRQDPNAAQPTNIRESKIPFEFGRETDDGYPHQGTLDFTENRVDATTGTIQVRGVVANPDSLFVPGSRVRVRIPVSDNYQAVLVPDTAILTDQDKKYVLVVDDKNTVLRRDVKLGKLLADGMRDPGRRRQERTSDIVVLGLQRATGQLSRGTRGRRGSPSASPAVQRGGQVDSTGRQSGRRQSRRVKIVGWSSDRSGNLSYAMKGLSMFSHFFIDRPIFATVLSIVIVIVGVVAANAVADRPVSGGGAADGAGDRHLSRRQRRDRRRYRGHADRTGSQRRRADALHVVEMHQRRPDESWTSRSNWAPISTRPRCWCRTAWRLPRPSCRRKSNGSA